MSDIRVFVTFPQSNAVFAGETLQCKITFKNTAPPSNASADSPRLGPPSAASPRDAAVRSVGDRRSKAPPLSVPAHDGRRPERTTQRPPLSRPPPAGHSPSCGPPAVRSPALSAPLPAAPDGKGRSKHKHKRSISIVSVSSDLGAEGGGRDPSMRPQHSQPRSRGHGRSASLQISPRTQVGTMSGLPSGSGTATPRTPQTPFTPRMVESMKNFSFPATTPTAPALPPLPGKPSHVRSKSVNKAYRFPPVPLESRNPDNPAERLPKLAIDSQSLRPVEEGVARIDLRSPVDESDQDQLPSNRLLAGRSIAGDTPRSSADFYSLQNSTTDSLPSEYAPPRILRSAHNRRHSLLSIGPKEPETLMMGYAQVTGSFMLDGSLIQTSLFDEVKRKGVLGTQNGGGVVGLDNSKNDGGLLSGFGWGLGSGLSGLLGGKNMSTIAEMKDIASTKSVPILSTPQSILFVDLRLGPGEGRSYLYSFSLPKTIPPSHKGKAIKITYNLVVGTQRSGRGVVQPKMIEIPFRVLPNVGSNGIMHSHDLMSPVVLLRDEATTASLDQQGNATPPPRPAKQEPQQESSLEDFLSYVDSLLAPQDDDGSASSIALLSPSLEPGVKRLFLYDEQPTSRDAIEMAVRGHNNEPRDRKATIFEIARNGRRVAAVTLARPAYKLGETITAIIDFSNSQIPCYHIHASLESSENVAPDIALRSASSIHRATRKIYAQHSESTLFAKRIIFTPTIPASASPEFSTSGVAVQWVLRLEFITSAMSSQSAADSQEWLVEDLLEPTFADDRGELYEPKQNVFAESFDASIPVKIYPNGADPGGMGAIISSQASAAAMVGFAV